MPDTEQDDTPASGDASPVDDDATEVAEDLDDASPGPGATEPGDERRDRIDDAIGVLLDGFPDHGDETAEAIRAAEVIEDELEQLRGALDIARLTIEAARAREQGGPPSVIQALAEAARNVEAVAKDRRSAAEQGNYRFRGIDGVLTAVHGPMTAAGVIPVPEDLELIRERWEHWSGSFYLYRVHLRWRFYGPAGDYLEVTNWGEALDNADKGLGKARSYAMKDLLIRMFTIPTNDPDMGDTEHTQFPADHEPGDGTPAQSQRSAPARAAGPASAEDVEWVQAVLAGADDEHLEGLRTVWREKFGTTKPEGLDATQMRQAKPLVRGMIPQADAAAERGRDAILREQVAGEPDEGPDDASDGDTETAGRGPTGGEAGSEGDGAEGDTGESATDESEVAAAGGDDTSEDGDQQEDERKAIAVRVRSVAEKAPAEMVERISAEVKAEHHARVDAALRDYGDDPDGLHIDSRRMLLTMHRLENELEAGGES